MSEPYTDMEIERMWREEMKKRENCSDDFRSLMSWMFELQEYKKVMGLAHLPNPYIKLIKPDSKKASK